MTRSCIICEMVCLGKSCNYYDTLGSLSWRCSSFKVSNLHLWKGWEGVLPFGLQSVPPRTINMDTNPIPYFKGDSISKIHYFKGSCTISTPTETEIDFDFQTQPPNQLVQASSVQTVTGCAKNKGLIGFSAAWRNFWVGKVLFCGVRKLKVKFPCQDWW